MCFVFIPHRKLRFAIAGCQARNWQLHSPQLKNEVFYEA